MSYYPDLSPYDYWPSLLPLKNVGWLEPGGEFPTGEVPSGAMDALVELVGEPDAVTRGVHRCEFCPTLEAVDDTGRLMVHGSELFLGNAEVRVRDDEGTWYAAPTLVAHYIDAHGYRPPAGFVAALTRPRAQDVELKRVDALLSFYLDREELEALLAWLHDARGDAWTTPGESGLRASRHGGRVLLTVDDEDEDDPDDTAECDEAPLVEMLATALVAHA